MLRFSCKNSHSIIIHLGSYCTRQLSSVKILGLMILKFETSYHTVTCLSCEMPAGFTQPVLEICLFIHLELSKRSYHKKITSSTVSYDALQGIQSVILNII